MTTLDIKAPLSGFIMPIEDVPDPTFAQKMLGDGLAIDPITNQLRAPVDGRIVQLHEAQHALTIATRDGLEILIHIGLNTVELNGSGFVAHVRQDDRVRAGDLLVEFDPDYIAQHAPSLLTVIAVLSSDLVRDYGKRYGQATAGETVIMQLNLGGAPDVVEQALEEGRALASEPIPLPNAHGLHARPAAVLATLARDFQSDIRLKKGGATANAKSILALLNLNAHQGDALTLLAVGPDAREALDTLTPAVAGGLGAEGAAAVSGVPASVARDAIDNPPPRLRLTEPDVLAGVTASPGIAVGNIHQFRRREVRIDPQGCGDPAAERARLDRAIAQAALELQALQAGLNADDDPGKAAIFAAQEALLSDPELLEMAQSAINSHAGAAHAWQTAVNTQANRLQAMGSKLLALRAGDLRDVGRRVLSHLSGEPRQAIAVPVNTILIAEDLAPSDVASLDRDRVIGIATTLGGASSHAAVLARALDLPAVAGLEARALDLPDGTPVILDATRGNMRLKPRKEEIAYVVGMLRKRRQKRQRDLETALDPAVTSDGRRIAVLANINSQPDVEQAMALGGEGVGLLRTEYLFVDRRTPPSEQEQAEQYAAIAGVLGRKRPLIIRTLDLGGGKPLPYLPIPPQSNPFLGDRGIRIGLDRPQLLRTQVRAILRASSAGGSIRLLLPMIATLDEWRRAKALVDQEVAALGVEPIPVGILIQVPAAALLAEQFAREAGFFSIGTNDLAQYTLAMDRGHPKLAPLVDALHPAVLRLVAQAAAGAARHKRELGVCGAIAGDPQAVPILMGLGITSLSVSVPLIPTIKSLVRSLSFEAARENAGRALSLENAAEVRALYPLEDYEL